MIPTERGVSIPQGDARVGLRIRGHHGASASSAGRRLASASAERRISVPFESATPADSSVVRGVRC